MINSCVLVGRLGNDPEMRYTPSGTAVVNFRMAVTRQRRSQDAEEQTDWLNIVAFGKTAEFVAQYLDKGSLIGVEGRVQSRTWETQDGQRRSAVEIVANNIQALESRQEAERRRAAKGQAAPTPSEEAPPPDEVEPPSETEDPFGDD